MRHRALHIGLLCTLLLSVALRAGEAPAGQNVFICGHSFHVFVAKPLDQMAKAAGINGHASAGVQMIGGSSVTQHWDLPDEKNKCKTALNSGKVDVLTLAPNWVMPDPAMDRFVDLALSKNPNTRVIVQMSWPAFDGIGKGMSGAVKSNEERDTRPVEKVAEAMTAMKPVFEKQINDINARVGKQCVYVTPAALAILALRQKIEKGEAPVVKKQSELFTDPLGHGKDVIQNLVSYTNFATIYRTSPVGLKTFERPGDAEWNKLNHILQEIAWEAVCAYPLSGVKK